MHQGFYHPPVVRRGAHPIREYGASDASATAYPVLKPAVKPASTGAYSDTGGYAWSYDSFSKAIRMIASPKDDQPAWQFDPSHSQWQRIYDAVSTSRARAGTARRLRPGLPPRTFSAPRTPSI
jgi:hypothetical protein